MVFVHLFCNYSYITLLFIFMFVIFFWVTFDLCLIFWQKKENFIFSRTQRLKTNWKLSKKRKINCGFATKNQTVITNSNIVVDIKKKPKTIGPLIFIIWKQKKENFWKQNKETKDWYFLFQVFKEAQSFCKKNAKLLPGFLCVPQI